MMDGDDDERKNEQKPKIKYRLETLTTDTSYYLNKRRRNHNISQLTLQGISNGEFLTVYLHWLFRYVFFRIRCCWFVFSMFWYPAWRLRFSSVVDSKMKRNNHRYYPRSRACL
jgi:hypothetical protein